MSVKLYLDADVTSAPLLASILRQRGFDVISAVEVGNDALDDSEQLEYAIQNQRVLLTFNIKDFVPLARSLYDESREHSGIIVSPQIKGDEFHVLLRLVSSFLNRADETSVRNTVRFLQEFR